MASKMAKNPVYEPTLSAMLLHQMEHIMTTRLDHANIVVRDIDSTISFLQAAFPDFQVRREWSDEGRRCLHIGNDDTYIALNESTVEPMEKWQPYTGKPGVNHLGFEVDDVEALRKRLVAAGFPDTTYPNNHPHRKRVYFNDAEGNDWEFVQYLSDVTAERNDYELSD